MRKEPFLVMLLPLIQAFLGLYDIMGAAQGTVHAAIFSFEEKSVEKNDSFGKTIKKNACSPEVTRRTELLHYSIWKEPFGIYMLKLPRGIRLHFRNTLPLESSRNGYRDRGITPVLIDVEVRADR